MPNQVASRTNPVRLLTASIILAAMAMVGCGDDNGKRTPFDFEGLWLIASITADVGGSIETRERDGTPLAVRGDVFFAAATNKTGTLSIRQVFLDGNVPQGPLLLREDAVELDEDRWVLTESTGDVSVYLAELDGDALNLTWDEDDPRNASTEPPPSAILADRAPPWGTSTVGTWQQLGDCFSTAIPCPLPPICPTTTIPVSAQYAAELDGSRRHVGEWTITLSGYLGGECSGPAAESVSVTLFGLLEEEGDRLRSWWPVATNGQVTLPPDSRVLDFNVAGDVLSSTLASCNPTPACVG